MTITGTTRVAAVLGWPVTHSRSPQILNAAFTATGVDGVMIPIGVAPDHLADAVRGLRAMRAFGASVTVPHKLAVRALCDEVTPAARAIGAVNCLQLDGGRLVGHNTDAPGYVAGLVAAGFALDGARAVLLGAGGAARAVAHGLRGGGCAVEVMARRPDEVTWATARAWTQSELVAAFSAADLVVDCTPIALGSEADERVWTDALPLDLLRAPTWISSLVYHRPTLLLERARSRGHTTLDGRAMLVHQAALAFALWTGRTAPVDVMSHALDASLGGT
ncbi:MAG: shikimate dehydrogenase [Kofleriaceae bacterium]|nr:shikimate dehydrogenase [Kofleriaceae bacterium]